PSCEFIFFTLRGLRSNGIMRQLPYPRLAAPRLLHDLMPDTGPPTTSQRPDRARRSRSSHPVALWNPHKDRPAPATCRSSPAPSSPPNSVSAGCCLPERHSAPALARMPCKPLRPAPVPPSSLPATQPHSHMPSKGISFSASVIDCRRLIPPPL